MDKSNLIVNYLPTGFTEDDLRAIFLTFGAINSIKVCGSLALARNILRYQIVRDKASGISMGFGFVNFETNDAALTAMTAMNGSQLPHGKMMKISLARPAWKANIHSNVYVSGLPLEFDEDDILKLFQDFSEHIENIRKLRDSRGVFRGIAVVRFDSEEASHDAMKDLNGFCISQASGPIQVRPWRPEFRPERIDSSFASGSSTKSLSPTPSASYAALTTPSPTGFNKISSLSSPSAPPQVEGGWQEIWSRYVESQMERNSFLTLPVQASRYQRVSRLAGKAGPLLGVPSLFVFHLPPEATESTLRILFEPYGEITSVRVLPGKGYGFVNFNEMQAALTAIHALNGFKLGNKHLKVEFKKPAGIPSPTTVSKVEFKKPAGIPSPTTVRC